MGARCLTVGQHFILEGPGTRSIFLVARVDPPFIGATFDEITSRHFLAWLFVLGSAPSPASSGINARTS
jgi:hypothetical protein